MADNLMYSIQKLVRKHTVAWLLLMVGVAFLVPGSARRVQAQEYRLGPEDVLTVTVQRHPEMSAEQVTVTSTGKIDLPSAGTIVVSGRTLREVTAQITQRLSKTLRQPQVTVALKQQRVRQVFVLGNAIERTGPFEIKSGWRVSNVLALAGSFKVRSDLVGATLSRHGRKLPLDINGILKDSTHKSNVTLQAGDTLTFTARTISVTVSGQVVTPGVVNDLAVGSDVVQAVIRAGGHTSKAALTKAVVQRADGTVVPVNLYDALVLGKKQNLLRLRADDLIILPEYRERVNVMGEVPNPGLKNLEEGRVIRLTELLAQAGGVGPKPKDIRISLARESSDGQLQISNIDTISLLQLTDPTQNVAVQDGDTISVVNTAKTQTVFVSGEVNTPGPVELKEDANLAKLIAQAGGPKDEAALRRVTVERAGQTFIVDLYDALKNGAPLNSDVTLQDGDFVVVPKNTAHILVMPGVNTPGKQLFPESGQLSVTDALAAAGGPKERAKLKEVTLLRETPAGLQKRPIPLDKIQNWQAAGKIAMQPGDVLYVPDPTDKKKSFLEKVQSLSIFGLLF
ncbi:MAG TPA: SLBB domain-containing protein [Abditibacteriaceae bacterium]|jgi:polysaccharide export outer membrane protein